MSTKLPAITEGYSPCDIYNSDESGLFYNALPKQTLAVKGDTCTDGKRSKERLTVLFGVNADGSDKLRPLVIAKAARPRCFKNVRSFPTDYANNSKAWMTAARFGDVMKTLDSRMRREGRKVLALVDNCAAHPKDLSLTNVRLEFFPPNCTSRLQPLDLGIIATVKKRFRKRLIQKVIASIDQHNDAISIKLNVLQVSLNFNFLFQEFPFLRNVFKAKHCQ